MLPEAKMKEQAKQEVKKLVERFRYNIDVYKKSAYNEAQVRREFIDPFFEALGWDVSNKQGHAEQYKEVIHEDAIKVGHSTRAPDYSFRIGGQRKFFVEAKKPAVNIKEDISPSYQLRRYAWSAKLPLSILTDFEELSVFDCQIKPSPNDKPSVGRIAYFTFDEYLDKFDEIYDVFSQEAVLKGSFDRYAQSTKGKKGTAEVDSEFLKEIESWRELLAKNIALRNPDLSIYELNYAVQKLLDRIIFLRICEDRGIEHYGQLQTKASESTDVYTHLLNHFKLAESKYNSGIFDFYADNITTSLSIDDKVLKTIIQSLYYPKSPYEFSVLGVEILGNVYEQFLGKVIRLTAGHQAKVETKPEVKKAGGVYYTPQYIVDYIVRNTVGKLIEGKTPDEIAEIKLVDPACGSGSFLIGAYTYLLRYHLDYYTSNEPKKRKKEIFQVRENEWYLTTAEKKRILLNNIFGVDIDPQAVEVTKLSLLLKVLEHESRESIDQQAKLGLEGMLPNLAGNIKCGNSLIGPDFYDTQQQTALFDEAEMRRINVFDWNDDVKGFGEIMKRGGFDCVIGNPPYIRIQALKEWASQEVEFYKDRYISANKGNYDIYVVFLERGLSLLSYKGVLGYILPHKFFQAKYGQPLRKLIGEGRHLYEVVHFADQQVFMNSTTYTCLLFLCKKGGQTFHFVKVHNLDAWKTTKKAESGEIELNKVIEKEWNFVIGKSATLIEKLNKVSPKLGDVARIFVGLQTSADQVFILDSPRNIEPEVLRPFLKSQSIEPYGYPDTHSWMLFPYYLKDGKAVLISKADFENKYPNAWKHLKSHEKTLRERERGKWDHEQWYAFGRSQNLTQMEDPKLIIQVLSLSPRWIYDDRSLYMTGGGGGPFYGLRPQKDDINIFYLLGILNSRLFGYIIANQSTQMRGGYIRFSKQYIETSPIRTIDFSNPEDVAKHDKLVSLVENMLELQKKHHETRMERDKELYERQIKVVDAQIDRLVYELYGLTAEEIKVIEGMER